MKEEKTSFKIKNGRGTKKRQPKHKNGKWGMRKCALHSNKPKIATRRQKVGHVPPTSKVLRRKKKDRSDRRGETHHEPASPEASEIRGRAPKEESGTRSHACKCHLARETSPVISLGSRRKGGFIC